MQTAMLIMLLCYCVLFKVGDGTLSIKFAGHLNDKMRGFYRSKYSSLDGEVRYGAVTQFEVSVISFASLLGTVLHCYCVT